MYLCTYVSRKMLKNCWISPWRTLMAAVLLTLEGIFLYIFFKLYIGTYRWLFLHFDSTKRINYFFYIFIIFFIFWITSVSNAASTDSVRFIWRKIVFVKLECHFYFIEIYIIYILIIDAVRLYIFSKAIVCLMFITNS